jgi:hypothetical protein
MTPCSLVGGHTDAEKCIESVSVHMEFVQNIAIHHLQYKVSKHRQLHHKTHNCMDFTLYVLNTVWLNDILSLLFSVSGSKLKLLTAVMSLIFLTEPYILQYRFYTSKNKEMIVANDYEMQVM